MLITVSEHKYKSLVELTSEIIETTDSQGKFIDVNDAFKKTLEFNDDDISKLTVMDILAPELKHQYKANPSKEDFTV